MYKLFFYDKNINVFKSDLLVFQKCDKIALRYGNCTLLGE